MGFAYGLGFLQNLTGGRVQQQIYSRYDGTISGTSPERVIHRAQPHPTNRRLTKEAELPQSLPGLPGLFEPSRRAQALLPDDFHPPPVRNH
ncbi:hypothetical protein B0H10DRAFT_2038245 [Mycena sp. CBHHK59/15]|nr:hypothetical protein B0H10DRAFT_2038245 [Mycena sp. CBHHK59/15]